jgi:PncC family amidohydrolase
MEECNIQSRAIALAESVMRILSPDSRTLALAESCTAGLASDLLARIPGASAFLWGSFVCYTGEAKLSMLGLDRDRLLRYGMVSRETVCDMANGALEKSGVYIAAAVTGLAGPDGDGSAVPVGTVWTAVALREKGIARVEEHHFTGSRNEIRLRAAMAVFELLLDIDRKKQ